MDHDLFSYPRSPGFKERTTSRGAAEAQRGRAATLRQRCLAELRAADLTPDETAARLGEGVLSVRPRISELVAAGLAEPTGERRRNASGLSAKVYRAARCRDG